MLGGAASLHRGAKTALPASQRVYQLNCIGCLLSLSHQVAIPIVAQVIKLLLYTLLHLITRVSGPKAARRGILKLTLILILILTVVPEQQGAKLLLLVVRVILVIGHLRGGEIGRGDLVVPDKLPGHVLEVKSGVLIGHLARRHHFPLDPILLPHLICTDYHSVRFSVEPFVLFHRDLLARDVTFLCQRVLPAHIVELGGRCALRLVAD